MKYYLLVFSFFFCRVGLSQPDTLCIEKFSRNNYIAGNDTSLTFYKTLPQNGTNKILLFTVRPYTIQSETPVISKTDINGDILWSRSVIPENHKVEKFDAIVLNNNTIFIFFIVAPTVQNPERVYYLLWLDENGNPVRQKSFHLKNPIYSSLSLSNDFKLSETKTGNIIFAFNYFDNVNEKGHTYVGSISATGDLQWSSDLIPSKGPTSLIDVIAADKYIIIQSLAYDPPLPFHILNSTKLDINNGAFIRSISYQDYSYFSSGSTQSCRSVLTDDYKIKTLISWRIEKYYQIYFSFIQDTSLNLLKSTTFYTTTSSVSYLPSSATINKKGEGLIKTFGTTDASNIGYFVTDINDNVLSQNKFSINYPFGLPGNGDVEFGNKKEVYVYWNDRVNGMNIVGSIKTRIQGDEGLCGIKDSAFIQSAFYQMGVNSWKFTQVESASLEPVTLNVSILSPKINKVKICEKITSFCTPIKINPVDKVCSLLQPVKLTVVKNPECRGSILFHFDTASVKSWQQPDDTTLLLQFDKNWHGKVYATASFCPLVNDSIQLIVDLPLTGINLGRDTILCKGDTLKLSVGNNFSKYSWENSSTLPYHLVTKGGLYYLTVQDACGRSYSDSINIQLIHKKPVISIADLSICKKETAELSVKGDFIRYEWLPANNISSTSAKTVLINPELSTLYTVTTTSIEGCKAKDSILVTVNDCLQTFFIPSAFTPNNDGLNDSFRPVIVAALEKYEFSIYNRWGQRIFYSTNKLNGWDGKFGGINQDVGIFVWTCTYKFYDKPAEFKKGTFTLIR